MKYFYLYHYLFDIYLLPLQTFLNNKQTNYEQTYQT